MTESIATALRHDLDAAVLVLKQGGVVAFPTETYYGLAVDPLNPQAVARLFQVKKRQASKPILVLIDSLARLPEFAAEIPIVFERLMTKFWPGPLTMIFPARPELPTALTAGSGTVGIRLSSHPVASALCTAAGGAITATSANLADHPPAASEEEVTAQFGDELDFLLRGGRTPGGQASTVVAAHDHCLRLVRQGAIPFACLQTGSSGIAC